MAEFTFRMRCTLANDADRIVTVVIAREGGDFILVQDDVHEWWEDATNLIPLD